MPSSKFLRIEYLQLASIFLRIIDDNWEYTGLKRNYRLLDQFDQKYLVFRNLYSYLKVNDPAEIIGSHFVNRWVKVDISLKLTPSFHSKLTPHFDTPFLC